MDWWLQICVFLWSIYWSFTKAKCDGERFLWQHVSGERVDFIAGEIYKNHNYGEIGFYSSDSIPQPRSNFAQVTMEQFGESRHFIMGGFTYNVTFLLFGLLDDIWEYNTTMEQWRFVYGSKDKLNVQSAYIDDINFDPGNKIYSLQSHAGVAWRSSLLFYGGIRGLSNPPDPSDCSYCNSLWQFSLVNFQWRWDFGGRISIAESSFGVYNGIGNIGTPGGRIGHVFVAVKDKFILFAGIGYGYLQELYEVGVKNDMWSYDPALKQFTWIKGSNEVGLSVGYSVGEKGKFEASNEITPRQYMTSCVLGDSFYIFGGKGNNETLIRTLHLSDLWKYNVTTNMWGWISGKWDKNYDIPPHGAYGNFSSDFGPSFRISSKIIVFIGSRGEGSPYLLLLGGNGFFVGELFFSDCWLFDPVSNEWAIVYSNPFSTGQRTFIYVENDYSVINRPPSRAGHMLFTTSHIRNGLKITKEVYFFGGRGTGDASGTALHNDVWKGRLSFACNGLEEFEEGVCSDRGRCEIDQICKCVLSSSLYNGDFCENINCPRVNGSDIDCHGHGGCTVPNVCECDDDWGDSDSDTACKFPRCGGIVGGENSVCTGHGVCQDDHSCDCAYAYFGEFCSRVNTVALTLERDWWFWFLIFPVIILVGCGLFWTGVVYFGRVLWRQKKKLYRFGGIEDIDILLMEQETDEKGVNIGAHLKFDKTLFQLDIADVKIISVLGSGGSSSIVYKVMWSGQTVAYKCFKLKDIVGSTTSSIMEEESQRRYEEFEIELNLLAGLNHPNIIRFFGAVLSKKRVGFLMELCSKGDLKDFLMKSDVNMDRKLSMMKEIASAVAYIHQRNVIHRDLKCRNILIMEDETTRLMDFGLSRKIESAEMSKTKAIGTSHYMAPEMVLGLEYDEKIDVFSFGILVYEMLTRNFNPYKNDEKVEQNMFVEAKVAHDPSYRPNLSKLPPDVPKWTKYLLRMLWHHQAKQRPSFDEILKLFSTKKGKKVSILIYLGLEGKPADEAEDFLLSALTISGLKILVKKNFKVKNFILKSGGEIISTDSEVEELKDDAYVTVIVKRSSFVNGKPLPKSPTKTVSIEELNRREKLWKEKEEKLLKENRWQKEELFRLRQKDIANKPRRSMPPSFPSKKSRSVSKHPEQGKQRKSYSKI